MRSPSRGSITDHSCSRILPQKAHLLLVLHGRTGGFPLKHIGHIGLGGKTAVQSDLGKGFVCRGQQELDGADTFAEQIAVGGLSGSRDKKIVKINFAQMDLVRNIGKRDVPGVVGVDVVQGSLYHPGIFMPVGCVLCVYLGVFYQDGYDI